MTADPPAGRELDALMAEKVMGWQNAGKRFDLQWGTEGPMWSTDGRHGWMRLPEFSTDIDAAWQILAGWSVTLAHAEGLPWHCHLSKFDKSEGMWVNGEGHADTAPLAICRAALKAAADRATPREQP